MKTGADALHELKPAEAESLKSGLCPSWALSETDISRAFVAKNFQAAVDALVAFARVAEEAGHHPDLAITKYRTVTVRLTTTGLGSKLSINDFIVAAKLDQVPVVYSPKWIKEHPDVSAGLPA